MQCGFFKKRKRKTQAWIYCVQSGNHINNLIHDLHDVKQQLSSCSYSLKSPKTHKTVVFNQAFPVLSLRYEGMSQLGKASWLKSSARQQPGLRAATSPGVPHLQPAAGCPGTARRTWRGTAPCSACRAPQPSPAPCPWSLVGSQTPARPRRRPAGCSSPRPPRSGSRSLCGDSTAASISPCSLREHAVPAALGVRALGSHWVKDTQPNAVPKGRASHKSPYYEHWLCQKCNLKAFSLNWTLM